MVLIRRRNLLKEKLADGRSVKGAMLATGSPVIAEIAAQSGLDFLIVDGEHGLGGSSALVSMVQAIMSTPTVALYRVPCFDARLISQAADLGFEGVLVPGISSAAEAEAIVAACRYPPGGNRGYAAGILRASDYGRCVPDYEEAGSANFFISPMIESEAGIAAANAIAGVDGVDLLTVGPLDLALDITGKTDPRDERVKTALAKLEEMSEQFRKPLGGPLFDPAEREHLEARGYRMFLAGTDVQLLAAGFDAMAAR